VSTTVAADVRSRSKPIGKKVAERSENLTPKRVRAPAATEALVEQSGLVR
jgi:hypothetical protein